MLLSKVPLDELMNLVDSVCEKVSSASIPDSIKRSSIRPAHDASKADFTLCLGHPLWKAWRANIEEVKKIIVESGDLPSLKIESCEHEITQYWLLHIKLNRLRSVTSIFTFCSSLQSASLGNVNGSQVVHEKVAVVTFKPPECDLSWDSLRLQLFSAATVQLVTTWTSKTSDECTSIEIINDPHEWCKEITSEEVSSQFNSLCPDVSETQGERFLVPVSPNLSIQPALPFTKVEVKKECNLLYLMIVLRKKLQTFSHDRLIVIVSSRSLANVQKALALLAPSVPIQLMPVESVSCDYSIQEFSDHLKNILITQSIKCDDSSDGEGGDFISMPQVDTKNLLSLFNTCLRCNLLSVKSSSHLTVKHEKNRNYLFIQYNIARIAAIVKQYEQQVANASQLNNINYSSLNSNEEWSLILNYLLPFHKLKLHYAKGGDTSVTLTPDKLIFFASNLAKDFGCYYSKTRILVDNWQTCPVTRARYHLVKCIQSILIDVMKIISVDPVLEM